MKLPVLRSVSSLNQPVRFPRPQPRQRLGALVAGVCGMLAGLLVWATPPAVRADNMLPNPSAEIGTDPNADYAVYRYDLAQALAQEAVWYASALAVRGPGKDAFSLLLESWIIAVQGIIKPPECNLLAEPIRELQTNLPILFIRRYAIT